MKNTQLSPQLRQLLSEKSNLCVSLILPLHEIPSYKKIDMLVVDHAIKKLRTHLEPVYDAELVRELIEKIKYLKDDIRHINGVKGIGIFMSEHVFHTETFPFEVQERIVAGSSFEVRDLLHKEFYLKKYFLLSLSGSEIRLFGGFGSELTEIRDHHFPASAEVPAAAMPVGNTTESESTLSRKRRAVILERPASFYNKLDKMLMEYIGPDNQLLLSGIEKEIAAFEHSTVHRNKICARINGSYESYNHHELEQKAWDMVQKCQEENEKKLLASLPELFGRELLSVGIQNVWRNARQGKGNVLLVEKDLVKPGFRGSDEYHLFLSPPAEAHEIITDAVDDIIETVLSKNGQVMFVPPGSLREFQHITMINRY